MMAGDVRNSARNLDERRRSIPPCSNAATDALFPRHYIEADDNAFQLRLGRWITAHHQRVVARDDVLPARGVGAQRIVGFQHLADVESRSEGASGLHVLVVMRHVGSEHDPAAAGMDADELHAWGVAADRVQTDAGSELDRSVVKAHPPGEVQPHDADDIIDLERAGEERVPIWRPVIVVQLDFLQMTARGKRWNVPTWS